MSFSRGPNTIYLLSTHNDRFILAARHAQSRQSNLFSFLLSRGRPLSCPLGFIWFVYPTNFYALISNFISQLTISRLLLHTRSSVVL